MPPSEIGCSSPDVGGDDCTTRFDNTYSTGFRELLYRWHPWCGLPVFVHQAIAKPDHIVFRCRLSGSDASRWLEIPAWMFDRAACVDDSMVTTTPYVDSSALVVLAGLLADVLKARTASSNGALSGAIMTSRYPNREEVHVRQDYGSPAASTAEPVQAGSAASGAADGSVRKRSIRQAHRSAGLAEAAGRGAKNADQPDGAVDLGTCRQEQDGRNEGGRP
jgi:hypothetical protein